MEGSSKSQAKTTAQSGDLRESQGPLRSSVLVVEDTDLNQMIASKILEKGGFTPKVVNNGMEAVVELMRSPHYALVLMDCYMPILDGYQATTMIRHMGEPYFRQVPIIAMTSSAMPKEREKCLKMGMDDYISKPFQDRDLIEVVATWFSRELGARGVTTNSISHIDMEIFQSVFDKHCAGSLEKLHLLSSAYLREGREYIGSICRLMGGVGSKELKAASSSLALRSKFFGATGLSELAEAVDQISGQAEGDFLELLAQAIRSEFEAVGAMLVGLSNKKTSLEVTSNL